MMTRRVVALLEGGQGRPDHTRGRGDVGARTCALSRATHFLSTCPARVCVGKGVGWLVSLVRVRMGREEVPACRRRGCFV